MGYHIPHSLARGSVFPFQPYYHCYAYPDSPFLRILAPMREKPFPHAKCRILLGVVTQAAAPLVYLRPWPLDPVCPQMTLDISGQSQHLPGGPWKLLDSLSLTFMVYPPGREFLGPHHCHHSATSRNICDPLLYPTPCFSSRIRSPHGFWNHNYSPHCLRLSESYPGLQGCQCVMPCSPSTRPPNPG